MRKPLYLIFGWLAFALGFAGIFLPLLPTVPLWILAAWLFTNSAPHLRERICNHPRFGATVSAFLDHGVLSRKGKLFAVMGIMGSVGLSLTLMAPPVWVVAVVACCVLAVVYWLLHRPEQVPSDEGCQPSDHQAR